MLQEKLRNWTNTPRRRGGEGGGGQKKFFLKGTKEKRNHDLKMRIAVNSGSDINKFNPSRAGIHESTSDKLGLQTNFTVLLILRILTFILSSHITLIIVYLLG